MFGTRFRSTFDMYFGTSREIPLEQSKCTTPMKKWREKQYIGHSAKVIASRRKKNKNARKTKKAHRR